MKTGKLVRQLVLGLILGGLFLAAPAHGAFGRKPKQEEGPPRAAMDAYSAMTQADAARDNEDWPGAISAYREALGLYRGLAASRPEWEPETVKYRIAYCASQIEMIGRETGQSADELVTNSVAAETPTDEEGFRERYFALLQENQYLRQRQTEMESDMGGVIVSTNGSGGADQLKAENEKLLAEIAELKASGSGPRDTELAARIGALDAERAALAGENEALKQRLEEAIMEGPSAEAAAGAQDATQEVLTRMREALAQERAGNPSAALEIYASVLKARPAYAEALKGKARCLLQQKKTYEAVAILRFVAFANRDDAQAQVLLGTAYCMAGQYNPAVEVLTPLVVKDPSNAHAQNAIGAAWMGLGDKRSAKTALEKAVALDPELADAHFNLAQVLVGTDAAGDEQARQHYRKAMSLGVPPDEELAKALAAP